MWDLIETEDKIINVISFLRKVKKKRPSLQEMFNEINRSGETSVDISLFKDAIHSLENEQVIYNGGKDRVLLCKL